MKTIRYAVVGLGHGLGHVGCIRRLPGAELTAVCDSDAGRLALCRQKYSLTDGQCYSSLGPLLDRKDIEAVVVATPPHTHKAVSLAVIKARKHLMLEKPLAHTVADGRAIARAAAKAHGVCQVAFCVRSSQLVAKCRQIIATGQIGQVVLGWFHLFLPRHDWAGTWRQTLDLGGGKLFDCCCHYLDILCLLADGRHHRVCAFGNKARRTGVPKDSLAEVASVIIELDNGVKLSLNLSEVTPARFHGQFGLVGTGGKVFGDLWGTEGAGSLKVYGNEGVYESEVNIMAAKASTGHLGFFEQHQDFYNSITRAAPVVSTVANALENSLMMDAILQAVRTGCVVTRRR